MLAKLTAVDVVSQSFLSRFSVVTNLRRHRKVPKGDSVSDHKSPEGLWACEK